MSKASHLDFKQAHREKRDGRGSQRKAARRGRTRVGDGPGYRDSDKRPSETESWRHGHENAATHVVSVRGPQVDGERENGSDEARPGLAYLGDGIGGVLVRFGPGPRRAQSLVA